MGKASTDRRAARAARFAIPLLVALTAVSLVACDSGDDGAASPAAQSSGDAGAPSTVPLAERFLTAADAPGTKADPVEKRQITADFTGDGEADLAVPGSRERGFAVGVIVGPVGPLSRMLGLQWHTTEDGATSDCVVSAAPVLRAEALTLPADRWGCASDDSADAFCAGVRRTEAWMRDVRTKGTQGLRVTGDDCVELHLYWSPESKAFSDWKKK